MAYHRKGFTLVELVVVILLIGILAAVAVPRIVTPQQMSEPGARQLLITSLGMVQQRAISQQCAYAIEISSAGWQALQAQDCSASNACWQAVANVSHPQPFSASDIRWVYWQHAWFEASASGCTDLTSLTSIVSPTTSVPLSDGRFTLHGWTGYAQ